MSLIVTGTIGIDSVYTPHGQAERVLGGSCTYFAAAASFYTPVRIVAAAGDDLPAPFLETIRHFKRIDTAGLEIRKGSKTFAWGGKYRDNMNGRDTLFTELGVLLETPPKVPANYVDSKYVFLANTHPAVQLGLLENFPKRKIAIADTMDLWISTARPELEKLLRRVDGLVLNYDEAELLTGKANTVAAARHILEMGPTFVVVKKGEHGCLIVHRDGMGALPAYPAEKVIDPTGAGDTFAGGMMGYLAQRCEQDAAADPRSIDLVRYSLAHGTIVASFNIESFSLDRLTRLSREQIDERYNEFARMVRVH
ncbi:MAG: sugar kinase [Phycisphaerales bacterium]|nr:sugar kinase [Phycisphaerales bacterium]